MTLPGVAFTAPDTDLAVGQKAVVGAVGYDGVGAVGLTLTGVEVGAPADLAADPQFATEYADHTPYYARITVTNESGHDLSGFFVDTGRAAFFDVVDYSNITVTASGLGTCEAFVADAEFSSVGASFDTCLVGIAVPGGRLGSLNYFGSSNGQIAGEPDAELGGVSWSF